jgi:hypothetical protein
MKSDGRRVPFGHLDPLAISLKSLYDRIGVLYSTNQHSSLKQTNGYSATDEHEIAAACANSGNEEHNDMKLKACAACKLVKY